MRTLVVKPEALKAIYRVTEFIESNNTYGSGDRWASRFFDFLESLAPLNVSFPLCHDAKLSKHGYSCLTYGKWVIAFKYSETRLTVYRIILGKRLK